MIHNDKPVGTSGIALNMRRPPLDDVPVRKALAYAFNREEMLAKLLHNLYTPLHSYHSGDWANPDNKHIKLNRTAQQLLAEAGWKERDREGYLVKGGKRLELELAYWVDRTLPGLSRPTRKTCAVLGVKLDLKRITAAALFPAVIGDRNFQMADMAWGSLRYMNPEAEWASDEPGGQQRRSSSQGRPCGRAVQGLRQGLQPG